MRKRKYVVATTAFVAVLAMGVAAFAGHGFEDVPDDHVFHEDIQWMKDNGITAGCNPAEGNTEYCPDDNVTRGQMAAFMHRFANNVGGSTDDPAGEPAPGETGEQGPEGPPGPPGEDGADGADGYVGNVLHNSFEADVAANSHARVASTCAGTDDAGLPDDTSYPIGGDAPNGAADGYVAVGGGYSIGNGSGSVDGVNVSMSRNELTYTQGNGWLVAVHNNNDEVVSVRAWVICIYAPDDDPAD